MDRSEIKAVVEQLDMRTDNIRKARGVPLELKDALANAHHDLRLLYVDDKTLQHVVEKLTADPDTAEMARDFAVLCRNIRQQFYMMAAQIGIDVNGDLKRDEMGRLVFS